MAEDNKWRDSNLNSMLTYRMGWNINEPRMPFDRCIPVALSDRIAIFIVIRDQASVIEDEKVLFPSDALVTKLRLIAGAGE